MSKPTDVERQRYQDRLQTLRDERRRESARRESREEGKTLGLAKGQKIGQIHFCERLLNRPETPIEQLAPLSLAELSRFADELQASLLKK